MKIIKNIGSLIGIVPKGVARKEGPAMSEVESIDNAFLTIKDGLIADFGPSGLCPHPSPGDEEWFCRCSVTLTPTSAMPVPGIRNS